MKVMASYLRTRKNRHNLVGSVSGQKVVVAKNIGTLYAGSANPSNRQIASRVILTLENCRALFNDYELEVPSHVISSITNLRQSLTDQLQNLDQDDILSKQLRVMRAACRKFQDYALDEYGNSKPIRIDLFESRPSLWQFCTALGELRASCGIALAILMNEYGLSCESDLAKILPADPGHSG